MYDGTRVFSCERIGAKEIEAFPLPTKPGLLAYLAFNPLILQGLTMALNRAGAGFDRLEIRKLTNGQWEVVASGEAGGCMEYGL